MSARSITDLLVTGVRGVFLVGTRKESWYTVICESSPDGDVIISGGSKDLSYEKVRCYKGNIRVGASMFFIRQDRNFLRTSEVTKIYDITILDDVDIALLKSA